MQYDGARLCGVEDTMGAGAVACKWPEKDITWGIVQNLPTLAQESFQRAAELAWKRWQDVCGIRPRMLSADRVNQANVLIGVQTIGPGGVLADSELPCGANMATQLRQRYDTAEDWVISDNPPSNKIDLVRVMCHEFGHVIGIPHIGSGNLMSPTYSVQIAGPMAGDRIEAVDRYGRPVATPIPDPPGPTDPNELKELFAYLQATNGQVFVRSGGVVRPLVV